MRFLIVCNLAHCITLTVIHLVILHLELVIVTPRFNTALLPHCLLTAALRLNLSVKVMHGAVELFSKVCLFKRLNGQHIVMRGLLDCSEYHLRITHEVVVYKRLNLLRLFAFLDLADLINSHRRSIAPVRLRIECIQRMFTLLQENNVRGCFCAAFKDIVRQTDCTDQIRMCRKILADARILLVQCTG